ncbi:13745_t:CDS:1 [Racocetra fulgida]|uniref:13745_t:CDS:1 n=1 Tax=Racocetra fulgida TaxID=60492 RepID=A0A9N9BFY0_9GLOM|nr:13745_t:CDS:1 [Racocetra fulgida]
MSDISIKSALMTDEHPPLPIVVSPPSPGLQPLDNHSHDSIHLTPHTPSTPRRRRSCSPSRSRSLSRSSSKIGVDSIEVHQVHSPDRHIDVIVINTDALSNNQKLTDSPTFLSVPSPHSDVENRDRDLSCSPPGHMTSMATESDAKGYHLSAPLSLIARTTFSRRKSTSRLTIVTTPAITISDDSCDNDVNDNSNNLSIHSCHSSITCPPSPLSIYEEKMSSSFNEAELARYTEPFKAFPGLSSTHGIWIAKFGGTMAILMAFGILTYDFVQLGMGTNVFVN